MPYIMRGEDGGIVAVFGEPQDEAREELSPNDPELNAFLSRNEGDAVDQTHAHAMLSASDTQMVRVLEDLVEILIHKGVILITDLPDEAQVKLSERRRLRKLLGVLDHMETDEISLL